MGNDRQTGEKHDHQRIELRSWCPDCGQELGHEVFNRADVEAQQAAELPNREAMSLINLNLAAPINIALAANVLSDGSIAAATAQQYTPVTQGT